MKLYPDSKVYIVCPGNFYTGGTELCHQLASKLLSMNIQAYIFYVPLFSGDFSKKDPVHAQFKKYHVPYTFELKDDARNIFIVSEAGSTWLYIMKKSQRIIWWLSVDNFIRNILEIFGKHFKSPLAEPLIRFFQFGDTDGDIEHWAQSEYARQFLKLNGVPDEKIHTVGDYLRQEFLEGAAQVDLSRKKNIVAFNPKKGFETTKKLIQLAPDIDWRPIENMTPAQVQELLALAKVYIDFGNHPGKDRIPREAAVSGCVVLVGKLGSAVNDVDINIPDEFKFDTSRRAWDIILKIREVFENYEVAYEKQAGYRARILDDKKRFDKDVAEVFSINKVYREGAALVQDVVDKSFFLAHELFHSEQFKPIFVVDDILANLKTSNEVILRKQNRNYLRVGENFVEIITRADARFLYLEGRIKNFALLEPDDEELNELKNFYKATNDDIMIFNQ